MARFRYSYGVSGRSAEEVSGQVHRLASLGYDAVELGAELSPEEAGKVRNLVEEAGMAVSSICPAFSPERDLSHPDPEVRENAMRYLQGVADLANAAGAPTIIVAPTAFLRTRPIASEGEEWDLAVESIRAVGDHAASAGVDLTLECWNRYHLSDSNRAAPGLGHMDFAAVLRALLEVGYPGYLTFELDPRAALRSGVVPAEWQEDPTPYLMEQAIRHLEHLESRLETR